MLENVRKKMDKAICLISGSFFALAVLATLLGMIDRTFGLGWKTVWAEEITRFSMAWAMFIIMGLCLRTGYQSAFTLILDYVSEKKKVILNVVILLLITLLFAIFFIYGSKMAIKNINQLSPVLQVSMFYPYVSMPAGALLVLFETVTALYESSREWKVLKIEEVH